MNKNFNLLRSQDGAPTRRRFAELGRSRSVLAEMSTAAPSNCSTSTHHLGGATVRVSSSQSTVHRSYVMHKSSSLNNALATSSCPKTPPQPPVRSRIDLCSIVEGHDLRQEDCVDNDINDSTLTRTAEQAITYQEHAPSPPATLTRINCNPLQTSSSRNHSDDNSPIWKRKDRPRQPPAPPKRNAPGVPLSLSPAPPNHTTTRQHLLSERTCCSSDTSSDTASINSDRMSYQSSAYTGNTSTSSLNSTSTASTASSSMLTPAFANSSSSSLTSNMDSVNSRIVPIQTPPPSQHGHPHLTGHNRGQSEFQKMPDRQRKRIYRIGLNIFNKFYFWEFKILI